jgi:hypothetical protein
LQRFAVATEDAAKWGFIDKMGKYAINPQFNDVGAFGEGLLLFASETTRPGSMAT